jgi:hypothetical protein
MRLRLHRKRTVEELNADFDWREVVCVSEEVAKTEAEKQQRLDDVDEAEWIYLRSEETGEWLARRTPRRLALPAPSFWDNVLTIFNPLS